MTPSSMPDHAADSASPTRSGPTGPTAPLAGAGGASSPAIAPHRPLPAYYGDESERAGFLRRVFDRTAVDYDRIERLLAFGTGPGYRRTVLQRAGLADGMEVLDVGFGTGLVAREALRLVGPSGRVVGVDPSPGMMEQGRTLQQQAGDRLALREGRAEQLPVDDTERFDFLSMGYALRHVSDVGAAFREYHRVLKPGGRLLILEITRPDNKAGAWALKTYMRNIVPALARVVSRDRDTAGLWQYYWDTIDGCIRPPQVCAMLAELGFTQVAHRAELGIFSEYTAVRAG